MGDLVKAAIVLAVVPYLGLILWIMYRGRLRITILLLTVSILILTTWSCTTGNGIHDIGIIVYPIAMLFGCLLLRPLDIWLLAAITAGCLIFLTAGEIYGWYEPIAPVASRAAYVVVMGLILVSGLLTISSVASNLKFATARALAEIEIQKNLARDMQTNLNEKTDLFREVHHRIKNHLAFINSLIDLQTMTHPDLDRQFIRELQGRVIAVARVHDQLYHTDDYNAVDTRKYLEGVVSQFMMSYHLTETLPDLKIDDFKMPVDTIIYLGIGIHEIIRTLAVQGLSPHKVEFILTKATRKTHLTVIFDHASGKRLAADDASLNILKLLAGKLGGKLDVIGGERKALIEMEF